MKRILSILLAIVTLVSAAWVIVPMVLIHPFRPQTPGRLAIGRALRTSGATLTLALLILGLLTAFLLWRRFASWRGRAVTCLAVAALGGAAFMGRWNIFESMFHPLPHPAFAPAGEAKDVADEDLVLGVTIGDEARAYPVRAMAYHHLVNDVVAAEPIVATY